MSGVLLVGCAGSAPNRSAATVSRSAGSASTSPSAAQFQQDLLDFANCMRANGVTNFPDPQPGGRLRLRVSGAPAYMAAQAECRKLLPNAGAAPTFSAQALVQLRQIAVCMRRHGVPDFPDPKRAPSSGPPNPPAGSDRITDYRGVLLAFPDTLDLQSPAFQQAGARCVAGFLTALG